MRTVEEYLDQIPMWATKKNTLKDIRAYLEELGNPDDESSIIHVAGTNGKGSVCSYLSSTLQAAGYRVAVFTSPHLVQVRERFRFDGDLVDEALFCQAFQVVKDLSDTMTGRGYQPPTYFEFLFYMFMVMVSRKRPEFVVLETGLGGRLDVTNVIRRPVLTVITSISMDHMQYLGDTVEAIAAEKAGIIKEGVPVVLDGSCQESSQVIIQRAEELGSMWSKVSCQDYQMISQDTQGTQFQVLWKKEPVLLKLRSQADYQMMNAALAVRSLEVLAEQGICDLAKEVLCSGMSDSFWPGRMEQVAEHVYLDGAHNAGGVKALNQTIRRMQKETGKPVTLMFGAVSDKDHHQMIRTICEGIHISHVIIAHMDSKRCADTDQLAEEFQQALAGEGTLIPVHVFPTVREAWSYFNETREQELAFCAGSLYLVGEVKSLLSGGTI